MALDILDVLLLAPPFPGPFAPLVVTPTPRVITASGHDGTSLIATGHIGTALTATGSLDMAVTKNLECNYGEDITFTVTITGVASISGWTTSYNLMTEDDETPLVTKTNASGQALTLTGTTLTIATTLTAANMTRTPGAYRYTVCRTQSGSKAVFTKGKWTISPPRVQ